MQDNVKYDPILLGFGNGYLDLSEEIVVAAKEMRKEIHLSHEVDFPRIHIVDHDYDEEKNIVYLQDNEFIIKVYGEEKVRRQVDQIQVEPMIQELKRVILENITELSHEEREEFWNFPA